jgi:hypothetical protein
LSDQTVEMGTDRRVTHFGWGWVGVGQAIPAIL